MKVLVYGAGALGSFVGGMLSRECDVVLVARRDHVEMTNSKGLAIEGKTNFTAHVRAFEDIPDEEFNLVLITVKSYDTVKAIEKLSGKVDENTLMLSLQNGLGNLDAISQHFKRVIGGSTSHGITFVEPGRIRHAGLGDTTLGNFKGVEDKDLEEICRIFKASGIETKTSGNILAEIWAKAIVNASINPLTAITRLRNGSLLKVEILEEIMANACKETVAVAKSCGIELPPYDLLEKTRNVARMTSDNKSSMLQDVENGKRTEIESITGVFIELGKKNDIPTPTNNTLYGLVKAIEDAYASEQGAIKN